jgi:hypothetical protein
MNYNHPLMPDDWYPGKTRRDYVMDWVDPIIANTPLIILLIVVIVFDWWIAP